MRRIRRPSPALVISLLALFVALGGTAVAAAIVPRARVADNALKLQGRTLRQVTAAAAAGANAPLTASVRSLKLDMSGEQTKDITLGCGAGEVAVGVGYDSPITLASSQPAAPSSWRILAFNTSKSGATASVYVVCVK
jgi:hypothetical protein